MNQEKKNTLLNKHIILGVCGGISAYKIPELIRLLRNKGAIVRIVMTKSAKKFITKLTLQTISGNTILNTLFDISTKNTINHIELAKWADIIILAPATANTIAKLRAGIANNLLTTICLASKATIAIVPTMNNQMYYAKATQDNLKKLKQREFIILGPDIGKQACGDIGMGCMISPLKIINFLNNHFYIKKDFKNIKIMITSGPTYENLDPIRFIGNYSSGKMGFAIADSASKRGAKVTLITGPVNLKTPKNVTRINVVNCLDMYKKVHKTISEQNIFISSAAISDYRPEKISKHKIKKEKNKKTIFLIKNPDIISSVSNLKQNRPYVVGFAAETQNIKKNAYQKLQEKKLDLICANKISIYNKIFNNNFNSLFLLDSNGCTKLPRSNKIELSQKLLDEIIYRYEKNRFKNSW
ncbi:bifunctional phosphopantothenoylcysteine decarboxylase/phosphopantothenate--cysteine ligase CoaBC [Candidatus Providencia siddallii]|uniref:Coenzyme A biosynthesis bifunctional protein CoaBC n=1 Tax=Candidatus Providencia siddallii TaxID=1715285 RepID=A0ABP1CD81_9GAMM